jgi:hypothetical protein
MFRASYSILSAWASGDFERAISAYYKEEVETTQQMKDGKAFHEKWEKEGKKTGKLPKVFGDLKFLHPQFEIKKARVLNNWLELVGVLDVKDGEMAIDYKTGVTDAQTYANSYQHKVYQILFPELKRFEYYHYNQYTDKADMAIVYLNDKTLGEGVEWVVTQASEMKAYLDDNEIILGGKNGEL